MSSETPEHEHEKENAGNAPEPVTRPVSIDPHPGLTSKQMTWAWLLSQWVSFAKSATGLPEDGWGKQAKDSVPHIIQLQALWHALGECRELPDHEVELAIDKAGHLCEKHSKELAEIWGMEDNLPLTIQEIIQDTVRRWALIASGFHGGQDGTDKGTPGKENIEFSFTKPVIGIAGGIASGKSYICQRFGRYACRVVDSDHIARSLLEVDEVIGEISAAFGKDVLSPTGQISRPKLSEIVFADEASLSQLESILHPRVRKMRELEREKAFKDPTVIAVVEDCPLLFEKGIDEDCDVTVFVDTPAEVREERAVSSRGWTKEAFQKREKAQLGLDIKAKRADYVIKNNVSPEESNAQTAAILSEILCNFPHNNLN